MKTIRSVDVKSFVLYGAMLAVLWTFIFGLVYWLLGWIFGAKADSIDVNIFMWSTYSFSTFWSVVWTSLLNGLAGALAGLVVALVYNAVAGLMGGIKIKLED